MHLNKHSPQIEAVLSDIGSTINDITPGSGTDYLVIDLSDMLFTIVIEEESQPMTAFTWEGRQYTFTRAPQRYRNSSVIAQNHLTQDIQAFDENTTHINQHFPCE